MPATIFVPDITSPAKAERIRNYGARLVIAGSRYADALAASEAHAEQTGAMPVHAYDHAETLLGQGTVGLELEHDAPDIDTLLVAVGGGGLIGGIAAWYSGLVRIVAVEPEQSPTLHAALAAGKPVDAPAGGLAADSLAPRRVGELMFPIAQAHVERSGRRRSRCGRHCAWSPSPAARRRSRRCSPADIARRRASGWRCCSAARIRLP
jgi:threonine dehydratase